jgi:hypothetical protein
LATNVLSNSLSLPKEILFLMGSQILLLSFTSAKSKGKDGHRTSEVALGKIHHTAILYATNPEYVGLHVYNSQKPLQAVCSSPNSPTGKFSTITLKQIIRDTQIQQIFLPFITGFPSY